MAAPGAPGGARGGACYRRQAVAYQEGETDVIRRAEPAGAEPRPARPAAAAAPACAARVRPPGRTGDRGGRAPGGTAGPGTVPAVLRPVVGAGGGAPRRRLLRAHG